MCNQAIQVTDDNDDESRTTFKSQDENENIPKYIITRSGNVIYKDLYHFD